MRQRKLSRYAKAQGRKYANVDFARGPATYRLASGYDLLYKLGEFRRGGRYHIADLAANKGLVGIEVSRRARRNNASAKVNFVDASEKALAKIPKGKMRDTRVSDLRKIDARAGEFTHTFCRYAVKNLPQTEQIKALREIARVTQKGGTFVLQDMVSFEGLQGFANAERRAKNLTTGDRVTKNHIPTEAEWASLLNKAGFEVTAVVREVSKVNTNDWIKSGQMTQKQLDSYFNFLLTAKKTNPAIWKNYKVRMEGKGFYLEYPISLFKCRKS